MKISSPSELLRPSEVAPRSADASSPKAKAEAEAPPPPPTNTTLSSMTKSAGVMDEADHAARLMSVAMALQSGRYSMDIMRIAEALTRQ
jgi:anti-sigma28 factor (negative regulator of flagellin synthesis)